MQMILRGSGTGASSRAPPGSWRTTPRGSAARARAQQRLDPPRGGMLGEAERRLRRLKPDSGGLGVAPIEREGEALPLRRCGRGLLDLGSRGIGSGPAEPRNNQAVARFELIVR